jgi:hypothetical protein
MSDLIICKECGDNGWIFIVNVMHMNQIQRIKLNLNDNTPIPSSQLVLEPCNNCDEGKSKIKIY